MSNRSWLSRLRAAAIYLAAWSPLVLIYIVEIESQEPISMSGAVAAALRSVGLAALLGLGVTAFATRLAWPEKMNARFAVAHFAASVLYGFAWTGGMLLLLLRAFGSWGEVIARASEWWGWQTCFGILLYWVVAGITWTRVAGARARERERAYLEADALRVRAELSALRGQLDPHFLFNTLHTAAVLTKHDPQSAAQALERLAELLRYVLDAQRGARDEVSLADELGFIDAYLALEGLRLGERLRVVREITPEAMQRRVPSLALQPLVENALRYGIAERAAGGTLTLRGRVDNGTLVLEVADDGPGTAAIAPPRGTGVGLHTLRERLRTRFGAAASMDVQTAPGHGFHVTLRLPA
jgi:two-component system, LytTR family, sensor kinase